MAGQTGIAWTDSTFNPWIGCTKVGPGCDNCYAAQQDKFRGWTPMGWGAGNPRKRTRPALWQEVLRWNRQPYFECASCGWRGTAKEWDRVGCCGQDNLTFTRRRVFCASLSDVFDNEVPEQWRSDLWALIGECTALDWLLVTKRIGNAMRMLPGDFARGAPWPHVWLGATVVTQEEADRDIPKLLATPAAVRFLSMEPLLGTVDLRSALRHRWTDPATNAVDPARRSLSWVIAGGESGNEARPCDLNWISAIVQQCEAAGVPVFVKQLGDHAVVDDVQHRYGPKGGNIAGWPERLRVRQHPASAVGVVA